MAKAGIVYVGTLDGLVTYSDPGGTGRWRRRDQALHGQAVHAIMAAGPLSLTVLGDAGAQRSEDGGQSWAAADPADAEAMRALLASPGPLVETAQGPAGWKSDHAPPPGARALALLAGKQEVLLAAADAGASLQRSEDGGASWQSAALDQPLQGAVAVIAPASYHMDIAWAGTDAGQLLRSDDRGRSWAQVAEVGAAILSLAVVRLI